MWQVNRLIKLKYINIIIEIKYEHKILCTCKIVSSDFIKL